MLIPLLKNLVYIIKHKYHVLVKARQLNITYLGIIHDLSKLLPSEFIPTALYFYKDKEANLSNYLRARNIHHHRNKHHRQYWSVHNGKTVTLEMPERYIKEMVCDWYAGLKTGTSRYANSMTDKPIDERLRNTYRLSSHEMTLHPTSRAKLRKILGLNKRR